MKRLSLAVLFTVGFGWPVLTAAAAAPGEVHIELHPAVFCCPQAGTWNASGAIADSGTYIRTVGHATGSIPVCPDLLEHKGAFQEEFLLTGTRGTLTLYLDGIAQVR